MDSCGVLIVGAGLAGLSAARHLISNDVGFDPKQLVIVEEGREVGGRLATCQMAGARLDHGAQFFTVRSSELQADVERWIEEGLVEEWCRGFAEIDGYPRYRVAGGMNALARSLAAELIEAGVTIATDLAVESISPPDGSRHPAGWVLHHPTEPLPTADSLIVTPPIPRSLELLAAGGTVLAEPQAKMLAEFAYHRVIALLAVLDAPAGLVEPGALQQPDDPLFSFVADNQAKGISSEPAVTFHTAHGRSAELWEESDERVLAALLPAASRLLEPAAIVDVSLHRWPFSGPVRPHPEPCLVADVSLELEPGDHAMAGPLVFAGDGFGGSKVEGAYLSGRAAAAAVANR